MSLKPDSKKISKALKIIAVALATAILAISIHYSEFFDWAKTFLNLDSIYEKSNNYPLAIYSQNIGNGGCSLIHCGQTNILIDCGLEKFQGNVCQTLDALAIETIDLAVLTHPDSDHIGNFGEVAENYCISKFVTCEYSKQDSSVLYESLVNDLEKNNVSIEYIGSGDFFDFGDISLKILSPDKIYKQSNDNSIVIKFQYNDFSALFMGDASQKAEGDILNHFYNELSADVLYVGHHGSGSSTSQKLIDAVSPKYAIIQCQDSTYLPNGNTIRRLMNSGCSIYRTDEVMTATVCVYSPNDGIHILSHSE